MLLKNSITKAGLKKYKKYPSLLFNSIYVSTNQLILMYKLINFPDKMFKMVDERFISTGKYSSL